MFERKVSEADFIATVEDIKRDMSKEVQKRCNLVRVLQQVLDKKTMSKKINIKNDWGSTVEVTVAEALGYIDP